MKNIQLLDCTLRDGGYVNDWEFGNNNLLSIYERLVDSGVDMIELCFIDERRPFDPNRSIIPDTASAKKIWGKSDKRPPMVVGMIDYGTCGIENIEPCEDSFFDAIRVIFKKHIMHEAMDFCAQVKAKGYKVFSQLVSVTTYNDEELKEISQLVNEVQPYAVSMVDTYGLLNPEKLLHIYEVLDANVDKDINIGFHAHNNFQLAYANCIAFLGRETDRNILVDGTLFGMGKSAGNAPAELLAMHLNDNYGKSYDINPMLESIEESIMDFYRKASWGYKLSFYLSAKNECHPSYVSQYESKENLSVSDMNDALSQIEPWDKKLLYDREVGEEVYKSCVEDIHEEDTIRYLSGLLKDKNVLLIGPGKNIKMQEDKVNEYVSKNDPYIISINYIPKDYKPDMIFVTKKKRYLQMCEQLHAEDNKNVKLLLTSNVDAFKGVEYHRVNRASLLESKEHIKDNSFLMLLRILQKSGIKNVACAGFDGYSNKEDNYYISNMEYPFVKGEADYLNAHIRDVLENEFADMTLDFITFSHYTEVIDSHDAAF